MSVYVIALPDSTSVGLLESQLGALGLAPIRINGFDGRIMQREAINRLADVEAGTWLYGYRLSATQVGCALSHREAYGKFLQSAVDWALICEDDACPNEDFTLAVDWILNHRFTNPVVIQLYTAGRVLAGRERLRIRRGICLQRLVTHSPGTVAYMINRSAAQIALNHATKVGSRADWPQWAALICFYSVQPSVVNHAIGQSFRPSTMQDTNESEERLTKIVRWLMLLSGITYLRLAKHYPFGFGQFLRHAVLPSAIWNSRRLRGKLCSGRR